MGPIGRWLVPLFLLALGLFLVWESSALYADGKTNLNFQNANCNTTNHSGPIACVTLSSDPETGYAALTGLLAGVTLIAGVWMTAVRGWRYWRERKPRLFGQPPIM